MKSNNLNSSLPSWLYQSKSSPSSFYQSSVLATSEVIQDDSSLQQYLREFESLEKSSVVGKKFSFSATYLRFSWPSKTYAHLYKQYQLVFFFCFRHGIFIIQFISCEQSCLILVWSICNVFLECSFKLHACISFYCKVCSGRRSSSVTAAISISLIGNYYQVFQLN